MSTSLTTLYSFADLLTLLPPPTRLPRHEPVIPPYSTDTTLTTVITDSHVRSKSTALVSRTAPILTDAQTGEASIERTIASVNQPADRTILATLQDALPTPLVPSSFPLPPAEEIEKELEETRAALERLVNGKIATRQPLNRRPLAIVSKPVDESPKQSIVEYQPNNNDESSKRIILIEERKRDPLSPPRFRHKRAPPPPPSPPAPVLHSPPRHRLTADEFRAWRIPPCVSAWKNPKGYTVPLDKRLAADGRHLQEHQVNERFAALTESLYVAEAQAREQVALRADMEKRMAGREREEREARMLELLRQTGHLDSLHLDRIARDHRPEMDDEGLFDEKVYARGATGINSGLADEDSYGLDDRPLGGQSAAGILSYKPTALTSGSTFLDADALDGTVNPAIAMEKGRRGGEFARLAAKDYSQPLAFTASIAASSTTMEDPFGLDSFLSAAKSQSRK